LFFGSCGSQSQPGRSPPTRPSQLQIISPLNECCSCY
jgi:hypothetical protein